MKRRLLILSIALFASSFVVSKSLNVSATDNIVSFQINTLQKTTNLSAKQIADLLGAEMDDSEISYLDTKGYMISYNDKIPTSMVTTSLNGDDLHVVAHKYSYTDINDYVITWYPYSAMLDNDEIIFSSVDDRYECVIENIDITKKNIDITYHLDVDLDASFINGFINDRYNQAKEYVDEDIVGKLHDEYLENLDIYETKLAEYNAYLDALSSYETELDLYNKYVVAKAAYDSKLDTYNKYLVELDAYNQEYEAYQQYLKDKKEYDEALIAYQKYLQDKEAWEANLEENEQAYEQYATKMIPINFVLGLMDLINTPMTSLERTVYSAVLGSTVTSVLSRQEDLTQLGAPKQVIDEAGEATINLREIFTDYFEFETDEEKYAYYKINYKTIKDNIEMLFRCLDKLYRSGTVPTAIKSQGEEYEEKYFILVAQLGMISRLIDDNDVKNYEGVTSMSYPNARLVDDNWTIGGRTILDILGDTYLEDINQAFQPKTRTYPEEPNVMPPVEVAMPTKVEEVYEPVAPKEVENPGAAPEVVNKPTIPVEVTSPIMPEETFVSSDVQQLIDGYINGNIVYRTPYDSNVSLTLSSTFNKEYIDNQEINIEFRKEDKVTIIKTITCDKDSYIVYDGIIPTKEADDVYSEYAFVGWMYEDKSLLNLDKVEKEGIVYPIFEGTKYQEYDVSFDVEGIITTKRIEYGNIPTYDGELHKDSDEYYYYTFASWDKEIIEVTGNITYVAIFDKFPLLGENDKVAKITNDEAKMIIDANDFISDGIDLGKAIEEYIDEPKPIEIHTGKFDVTLPSSLVISIKEDNINRFEIVDVVDGEYGHTYAFKFVDKYGNKKTYDNVVTITMNGLFDETHSRVYNKTTGDEIRANIKQSKLIFDANLDDEYEVYRVYQINTNSDENVDVILDSNTYKEHTLVTFDVNILKPGIQIDNVKALGLDDEIIMTNNSFIMPASNIYLIANYSYIKYTISFEVDGEIIQEKSYVYGDEVLAPSNIKKASDEHYSYTFISWDKEVSPATENLTYRAVFEQKERTDNQIEQKNGIIKWMIAGIVMFHILFSVSIGLLLIYFDKKRLKIG